MQKIVAVLVFIFCFVLPVAAQENAASSRNLSDTLLWYEKPSEKWTDALPIGNGRFGAMIFGGTAQEQLQFNEDTLWKGKPHDYVRAGAGEQLAEIRRLLFENKGDDAQKLVREKFLSDPVRQMPYQPFGDVRLQFPGHEKAETYRRELDLDTAVSRVRYRVNGVEFQREAFSSFPDRVIVLRLSASEKARLSFTVKMDSPHAASQTRALGDTLILSGKVQDDGLRFESRLRVLTQGGSLKTDENTLRIENADSAVLLLAAATSFKNFQDISADPAKRCAADLQRASRQSYAALLAAHSADHQGLFRRCAINLGRTPRAELPTDERLKQVRALGLDGDPAFAALYFHYGRYLLIASSRPGTQPSNLQGIWNDLMNPPWESKWTTNINVQMNYWPAELTNLSECHEPLFDLIDDLRISGKRTAQKQYGARGWVLHHNTDLWRGTAPINNVDGVWPTGGAWLCHHLWERYLFTGDEKFLRRAYPAMREAALFFVDFLIKDPKTGYLVTNPSHSPEQPPPGRATLGYGPAMDNQLIRALFNYTIEATRILDKDHDFAAQLAKLRDQLPPDLIGKHGQLQEWLEDLDAPNNTHRHMSPLWALYPGADITPQSGKVWDAAKVLLTWRGDGSTGWSYAWRIPLWARVGDGEFAYRQLNGMFQRKTLPNLFDLCGPYQIDGNFGGTAGMVEMLLQSHLREVEGGSRNMELPSSASTSHLPPSIFILELLPALPKAWPSGEIRGLRARGGLEVDIRWQGGALSQATIRAPRGGSCAVRYRGKSITLKLKRGGVITLNGALVTGTDIHQ